MLTEPSVEIVKYSVTAAEPELIGDINMLPYTLTVEQRGPNSWAIIWIGRDLDVNGKWDNAPLPSSRSDEWLSTHRFTLDRALAIAKAIAPTLTCNGSTIEDTEQWYAKLPESVRNGA